MIAYASRTGTRQNLAYLREHGWRLMLSAKGVWNNHGFPYAIDNGAWTAYQKQEPFDAAAFLGILATHGAGADFVVVPDIVAGGRASLDFSTVWIDRLQRLRLPLYLEVQDGMTPKDVDLIARGPDLRGLFVGGTSSWKDATTPTWALFGHRRDLRVHVGRVNTERRIRLCAGAGVDSIDGSGPSRWKRHAETMTRWMRQGSLILRGP